jgi:hypothetical protein
VRGRAFEQECALSLPQVRTHFENEISLRHRALRGELVEQIGRHHTGACAEFENRAAAYVLQDFAALVREAAGEQRRHLGRRDEIAARAELGRAGAVITEARLVQRHLHEALEAEPAAARVDLFPDAMDQAAAVRGLIRSQGRQR